MGGRGGGKSKEIILLNFYFCSSSSIASSSRKNPFAAFFIFLLFFHHTSVSRPKVNNGRVTKGIRVVWLETRQRAFKGRQLHGSMYDHHEKLQAKTRFNGMHTRKRSQRKRRIVS